MAWTKIIFENPHTGSIKEAPVGFSWTIFFFGFIPPIFRSDIKWTLLLLIFALFTMGLSNLVFMFIYNKIYIKDLMAKGYKIIGSDTPEFMQRIRLLEAKLKLKLPLIIQ